MGTFKIKEFNPEAAMLENILLATEDMSFCQTEAIYLVGGRAKLKALIAAGKIRAEKRNNCQNGKWWCNAADVLRHCKNMRR